MSLPLRAAAAALLLCLVLTSLGVARLQSPPAGVSMRKAADAFLTSLSEEQKKQAALDMDSPRRVEWHFIPKADRKGLQLRDMTDDQRKLAHELLAASLSEVGYKKTSTIMEMENLLLALEKGKTGTPLRDSLRYYFAVFGTPGDQGKWGLSIEGHHMSLNFVVEEGRVASFSPLALCSNPATVMTQTIPSIKKGQRLLGAEEQLAFDLLASLSAEQKKQAVIAEKALAEVRAAGEPQPPQTAPEGIAAADLEPAQQKVLMQLIDTYLANLPEEVAAHRSAAIEKSGSDKLHFAWAGAEKPGIGHYYRVQGPTFLIEFVNTQPDAAGNPANHIHCLWRSLEGDFGIPVAGK
jgi:hypothetical protein